MNKAAQFKDTCIHILCFILPPAILCAAYSLMGIDPWGDKTVLISDMEGQYIDFYCALYDILKSGRSLFYSSSAGMGTNFVGLFAYYLSSPFSFIILLFKKQNLCDALYWMILLKIGCAGLTFSIYLKYLYKKLDWFDGGFCLMYALMSYCVVYSFNIMWLDGPVMLPLVLLGCEKILNEEKPNIFVISLAVIFISNFYISYMVGVFSFIYFCAIYFSKHNFNKNFLKKLKTFLLSALLSAGIAAFIILPTYFALKSSYSSVKLSIGDFGVNLACLGLLGKLPIGAYDTLTVGLPNIYCGLFAALLSIIYFTDTNFTLREKACFLAVIIFFILSFIFNILNLFWHGFDNPDWFPYRYSFLFSFMLIFLSVRYFKNSHIKIKPVLIVSFIWSVSLCLIRLMHKSFFTEKILIINLIFLGIYTLLLCSLVWFKKLKTALLYVLLFFIILESFSSTFMYLKAMDGEFKYASRDKYFNSLTPIQYMLDNLKQMDGGVYRIERCGGVGRSFNDSMNMGYMGITHFNSMSNAALNKFLNSLGLMTPVSQAVQYTGSTLVSSSLLGIKYIISDRSVGYGFREVLRNGSTVLYENTYALPLGFMAGDGLLTINTSSNPFKLQNDILNTAIDNEEYYKFLSPISINKVKYENVSAANKGGMTEFEKADKTKEAYVEILLDNKKHGEVYMFLPSFEYSYVDVYVNDVFIDTYLHFYNKAVLDLGYIDTKGPIKIKLVLEGSSFSIIDKYFYILDTDAFYKAANSLKSGTLEITNFKDGFIEGTVNAKKPGLLFTSIPYDAGWTASVDGRAVPVKAVCGSLVGLMIPKGKHSVTLKFIPRGFKAGIIISIISITAFIFARHKILH